MAARQRRHGEERHLQPPAHQTDASASADPEAGWQLLKRTLDEMRIQYELVRQRVNRELSDRSEELMRRYRCTALRRCTDHSALVKQETGVSIDDPALKELAGLGRADPVMRASDAALLTWFGDTASYLNEVEKRLDAVAKTAPDDVNVPSVRDRAVAIVRDHAMETGSIARLFARVHARESPSTASSVDDSTLMDDLGRVAGTVRTWVREHAPTCRRLWLVVAAILVHHGWAITGATLTHQADSLRQLVRRRAV